MTKQAVLNSHGGLIFAFFLLLISKNSVILFPYTCIT